FSRILKREALGEGDIILIMLISSYTGLWGAYLAMLLGSLTALLVHFLFPEKIKGEIPFGPFLSFGAIIGALTL
ncbi:MAG: prepilin peptidase, partial [candidate division WOR-3 bacterium]